MKALAPLMTKLLIAWLVLGIVGFWVFGPETKGRTFEEMNDTLDTPATATAGSGARAPAE